MAKVDNRAFQKSVKQLQKKLKNAFIKAHEENMKQLEKEAKALAPYKTGELENRTKTEVTAEGDIIKGSVTFEVPYAALRHNKLDDMPGPGTRGKSPTTYGTPGPNYLQNPARGMGRDLSYHRNIDKETKKVK